MKRLLRKETKLFFTSLLKKKNLCTYKTGSGLGCSEAVARVCGALLSNSSDTEGFFLPLKEDVDSFMKQPGNETADVVLKKLDEQYQKYKFLELNLAQKKRR